MPTATVSLFQVNSVFDSLASLLCVERKHKCDKLEVLQEAIRVIEVRGKQCGRPI